MNEVDKRSILSPDDLGPLLTGLTIQALLNGGSLVLGVTCIFFLFLDKRNQSTRLVPGSGSKQPIFWASFITVLLVLNIGGPPVFICLHFLVPLYHHTPTNAGGPGGATMRLIFDAVLMLIVSLTDGLLVWRCYMVQTALGPYKWRWRKLMWVLPLGLFVSTLSAGTVGFIIAAQHLYHVYPAAPMEIALISNAALNTYATCFITIRLLQHSRMAKGLFGPKNTAMTIQHHRLVRIFVEAAVINVPLGLAAAIGRFQNQTFSYILLCNGSALQSFSTILILYQVALGKAIGQDEAYVAYAKRHDNNETARVTQPVEGQWAERAW